MQSCPLVTAFRILIALLLTFTIGAQGAEARSASSESSADEPAFTALASSTCTPDWQPAFGGGVGLPNRVRAIQEFDDGSGPALYVGGFFTSAANVTANYIARWDGSTWSDVGGGVSAMVDSLVVFDDGSGPALFAAGHFITAGGVSANRVAKWDGTSWTALGSGLDSYARVLHVHDDGGGEALYVGGFFSTAGGVSAEKVAKWDGTTWSPLSTGFPQINGEIWDMATFDAGSGAELYVGGVFNTAGGVPAKRIARWDGTTWAPLGSGVDRRIYAMAVFDDGSGEALFVGGRFETAGGVTVERIAKWDGSSWSALNSWITPWLESNVNNLVVHDDGTGPALFAGGTFITTVGAPSRNIAKWDGGSWSTLAAGLEGASFGASIEALGVFDDGRGGGPALVAGGMIDHSDSLVVNHVAHWDGEEWGAFVPGLDAEVFAIASFDDGGGTALYAGGDLVLAGGQTVNRIARFESGGWSALGAGVAGGGAPRVEALAVYDDGGGNDLYAAGSFSEAGGSLAGNVACWDGAEWSALGLGTDGDVLELVVFDDGGGPALFACGEFTSAGGAPAARIAKWDGTHWSDLAGGLDDDALAMAVFDDGSGEALYVGGRFQTAGAIAAARLARWDGTTWSSVGNGGVEAVAALVPYFDGAGTSLAVGGYSSLAGGTNKNQTASWNGSVWSTIGGKVNNDVYSLASHDDGSGPMLIAAGEFTRADGAVAFHLVRFDGTIWSPLGGGREGTARRLFSWHDGSGPALLVGGAFAYDSPDDSFLARWGGCENFVTYCTAGTSASGCQALMSASGIPSATATSGFDLTVASVEGSKRGIFYFAANGRQAAPWAGTSSFQCVVPPVIRTPLQQEVGTNGACDGAYTLDLNAYLQAKPHLNPGAGAVVQAQFWYRDPFAAGNNGTSMSDALEFVVGP